MAVRVSQTPSSALVPSQGKNKDGDIAENERADCLIGEAQPDEADNATKIPHAVCYPTPKDVNSENQVRWNPLPQARGEVNASLDQLFLVADEKARATWEAADVVPAQDRGIACGCTLEG